MREKEMNGEGERKEIWRGKKREEREKKELNRKRKIKINTWC